MQLTVDKLSRENTVNYICMANNKTFSNYGDVGDTESSEESIFTIIVFSETENEQQLEHVEEISIKCDIETAMENCARLARKEFKNLKKSERCDMRGVIYENGVLADMMFDPRWKKWFIISTSSGSWRYLFPENI